MRVYVAGSTKGVSRVQVVMAEVRRGGHEITFDWTGAEGEIRDNQADWANDLRRATELSGLERDAVLTADALVLVAPPANVAGLGCWMEVGIALGRQIPVLLVDGPRESLFWYLPNVYRTGLSLLLGALDHVQSQPESVLEEAERLVGGARADSYGHPAEHSTRVAGAWRSVFGWDVDAYRVNLAMALFKVARAAAGAHRDSLVDVAGYSRTAEAVLAREGAQGFQDLGPSR